MDSNQTPNSVPNNVFKLSDPRQIAIYDYLTRLVSEGAASFYKDACRHMATKPPFETTTHVVGHLLREIESALRAVLEGIAEPVKGGEKHKRQIETILKALGFSDEDPVAKAWISLPGDDGLQGLAHRDGLSSARPLDDEFIRKWDELNSILHAVLERFETKYTTVVFKTLDSLSAKTNPTQADVDILKSHIPNNRVAHEHFFNAISIPEWLPFLESSGFFKSPPPPERDLENNGIRYPVWPVLTYLSKVAPTSPVLVTKIVSEIPATENGNVKASLTEIVTRLPKENKIELIPHIKKWMNSGNQFLSAMKSIELVKSLTADQEMGSALILSRELLGFIPETRQQEKIEGIDWTPPLDPRTIVDEWHYSKFLRDDFPPIAQQDPMGALKVLLDLLSTYNDLKREGKEEDPPEDYSYIGRPLIESPERLGRDDADDSLITAIVAVSIDAINKNPALFEPIILELQKQKWPVFRRINLYLLSKYPEIKPVFSVEALINTSYIDDSNYQREYALLAQVGFKLLAPEQKKIIFDFIEKAEAKKERVAQLSDDPVIKENAEKIVKIWQRDKLALFDLSAEQQEKEKYEALVKELGEGDDPKTPERSTVFTSPVSDHKAETISQMSIDQIIELLKTWQPHENKYGFGSSKEGLGRELCIAVKKDIPEFSKHAMRFIDLDPTYVRNYIQAFSEVVQNNITFDWAPLIDLCTWVVEQPRDIPDRKGEDDWSNEDPHWGWARRSAITLISHGLNHNVIPFALHKKVWKIIETLSDDPNPTPEQELTREGTPIEDAYGLTINTVRGETLTAVVEYGLWMTRLIEKLPESERPSQSGFDLFPQVKKLLEKHLDDPSVAVRAVYGRYFPWILLIGRDWTIANLNKIFPTGQFGTPMYDASWKTYIGYVQAYDNVFEILKNQYMEAIKNIGTKIAKNNRFDIDSKLAEQLMIFYWRGKLDPTEPDGLFKAFWQHADTETKAHAIDFIGRNLHSLDEPLEDDAAKRLKELWEMRIKEAENAQDKSFYEKEMGSFGWWFASGKLDEDWSIKQFLRSLEFSGKVRGDYSVVDRLVILVESKPVEAISILQKLIKRDLQQWVLFGSEDDLKTIFSKALSSSEESAKTSAEALINRLVALGYTNYSYLLLPPSPPDPTP